MARRKLNQPFDIAVVGGGPSGRIAALTLAREGFKTVLVAPQPVGMDGRTTALWQKSIALLEKVGVWAPLESKTTPLRKMRMIDDTNRLVRAPEVVFDSNELGIECFGFNILNNDLNLVLEELCRRQDNLTLVEESVQAVHFGSDLAELQKTDGQSVKARLVVAADGRNSLIRETARIDVRRWAYPQEAVVLNLEHTLPHRDISTEFHTPTGPFTLVPLPGRESSLVCVETAEGARRLLAMEDEDLAFELERRAHSVLGKFKLATKPQSFPLAGLTATRFSANRLVLIGEAAHVFPPIGAQGLNLTLRDIMDLERILIMAKAKHQDPGAKTVLEAYEAKRTSDIHSRTRAVDALNRSLLTDFLPVQVARSAGMYFAGKIGPFRRLLMREGMAPGSLFRLNR